MKTILKYLGTIIIVIVFKLPELRSQIFADSFYISKSEIILSPIKGASDTFKIIGNGEYKIYNNIDWLILDNYILENDAIVTVSTSDYNVTSTDKIGYLTLSGSDQIIKIIQKATKISVVPNNIILGPNDTTINISLYAESNWNVDSNLYLGGINWVNIDKTEGIGNTVLEISVKANTDTTVRSLEVAFFGQGLCYFDIYQKTAHKCLEVYKDKYYASAESDSGLLQVRVLNVSSLEVDRSWVKVNDINTLSETSCLPFSVNANNTYESRSAHLTFNLVGLPSKTIEINQESKLKLKNFEPSNGLFGAHILSIVPDLKNNVWVLTDSGVSKFDGNTWSKLITTSNSVINCIAVDSSNILFAGTNNGIAKYDGINWNVTFFSDYNINTISFDQNNNLWFLTIAGELYKNSNDKFEKILTPFSEISQFAVDKENVLYVTTNNGMRPNRILVKYNGEKWDTIFEAERIGGAITKLYLEENNIWLSTVGAGITIWPINCSYNENWIRVIPNKNNISTRFIDDESTFDAINIDKNGKIWIGTSKWLRKYNGSDWIKYTSASGLISENIKCIAIDSENRKWIGTDKGISVITENDELINKITPSDHLEKLNFYPNPTSDCIKIISPDNSVKWNVVKVFDYTGRLILTRALPSLQQDKTVSLNLGSQPAGIYLVKLCVRNREYSGKVLLVK